MPADLFVLAEVADKMGTPVEAFLFAVLWVAPFCVLGVARPLPGIAGLLVIWAIGFFSIDDPGLGNWWEKELGYNWPLYMKAAWSMPFAVVAVILSMVFMRRRKRSKKRARYPD